MVASQKYIMQQLNYTISALQTKLEHIYGVDSTILDLRDFFISVPISIEFEFMTDEQWQYVKENKLVYSLFGAHIRRATSDYELMSQYLRVYFTVKIPRGDESVGKEFADHLRRHAEIQLSDVFLFMYMHEIMHILLHHYEPTVNTALERIFYEHKQKTGQEIPQELKDLYKNFALDFYINGYLLSRANDGSTWAKIRANIKKQAESGDDENAKEQFLPLYHEDFDPTRHSNINEYYVLQKLLENLKINQSKGGTCNSGSCNQGSDQGSSQGGSQGSDQGNSQGSDQGSGQGSGQGTSQGNSQGSGQGSGQGNSQGSDQGSGQNPFSYTEYELDYKGFKYKARVYNQAVQPGNQGGSGTGNCDVGELARSVANGLTQKIKGTGAAQLFRDLGAPLEVVVDWVQTLMSRVNTEVKKITDRTFTSWQRLKNKYRHIAHLPVVKYYDNVFDAVVSIDQSGSMSDNDLRKINYVLKELAQKSQRLHVIIHDFDIADYQVFENFEDRKIEEYLRKRRAAGGTSHKEVFEKIHELAQENSSLLYLSFSDNYSDIEEYIDKIQYCDTIEEFYWIMTEGGRMLNGVPGVQIDIETGKEIS